MIVTVPYVAGLLRPETFHAVSTGGRAYVFVELDRTDPGAYAKYVASRWPMRGEWCIVEQDMAPTPEQLAELARCERRWCRFPYDYDGRTIPGSFGVVRFRHGLRADWPRAAAEMARHNHNTVTWPHWASVSERLGAILTRHGETPHVHDSVVAHHHDFLNRRTDGAADHVRQ